MSKVTFKDRKCWHFCLEFQHLLISCFIFIHLFYFSFKSAIHRDFLSKKSLEQKKNVFPTPFSKLLQNNLTIFMMNILKFPRKLLTNHSFAKVNINCICFENTNLIQEINNARKLIFFLQKILIKSFKWFFFCKRKPSQNWRKNPSRTWQIRDIIYSMFSRS